MQVKNFHLTKNKNLPFKIEVKMENKVKRKRRTKQEMMKIRNMGKKEVYLSKEFNTVIGDKRNDIKNNKIVTIKDVKCILENNTYSIIYIVSDGKKEYECAVDNLRHLK